MPPTRPRRFASVRPQTIMLIAGIPTLLAMLPLAVPTRSQQPIVAVDGGISERQSVSGSEYKLDNME
eukprot:6186905-Prymnesium_polylepis.1